MSPSTATELTPVVKLVTHEDMDAFESVVWNRGPNVHNDPATAKAFGVSAPFASGMMQLAYVHEFMEKNFSDGWTVGGKVSARWTRLVYSDDVLTVEGTVTGIENGRATVDIKCTRGADGATTAVATATALVGRSGDER